MSKFTPKLLKAFGEEKSAKEWAEDPRCQVQAQMIHRRMRNLGWNEEKAVSEPFYPKIKYKAFGKEQNIAEWAREYEISEITLRQRISKKTKDNIEECLTLPVGVRENPEDCIGIIYNKTVLIKEILPFVNKFQKTMVSCECLQVNQGIKCGKEFQGILSSIKSGHLTSCGCFEHRIGPESNTWKGYGELSYRNYNRIKGNLVRGKNRILEFTITIEELWEIFLKQDRKCALSGIDITFGKHSEDNENNTASPDRIDSSKGYISGNVQWVHKKVNKIKWDCTDKELVNWAEKIYKHSLNKGK